LHQSGQLGGEIVHWKYLAESCLTVSSMLLGYHRIEQMAT
jgi:hypothetical protein